MWNWSQNLELGPGCSPTLHYCVVSPLSAGIGRTGCFIVSSIGCQQLRETGQVDILETVCQLRLDRWVRTVLSATCLSCNIWSISLTCGPSPRLLQRWYDPNHRAVPVPVLHTGPVQLPATTQPGTGSDRDDVQIRLSLCWWRNV